LDTQDQFIAKKIIKREKAAGKKIKNQKGEKP